MNPSQSASAKRLPRAVSNTSLPARHKPSGSSMKRAAIVSPIRTAVGKYLGALSDMTAGELGAVVLKALVERTGIDPEKIDDVIFAQGYASGEAPCIARYSALAAGLPIAIPGYQLDRRCGSGLQVGSEAATKVATRAGRVGIARRVESTSKA